MISAVVLAAEVTAALAQDAPSAATSYCPDLKRVTSLALAGSSLASIAGAPRASLHHFSKIGR
jgi:hypothetical protein